MTRFGFVVHPLTAKDAAKKYPWAAWLPDGAIEKLLSGKGPVMVGEIEGIRSKTGAETTGMFVGLPMTPRMMTETLPEDLVLDRISAAIEMCADAGADVVGLGAFTSVVGNGGEIVADRANVAVTTGNSYTVATAIEGTTMACHRLGLDPADCKLAVVGATGSIGRTCALALAPDFGQTVLVGRDLERTQRVADEIPGAEATTDLSTLADADAIVTVSSAGKAIIQPEHLKPGCVVCDVARPRDVSRNVVKKRSDVLVIEGGVVRVPGPPRFPVDFGFPPGTAYACMSETMMLALEDRRENFTVGKTVTVEQVRETQTWAAKHGFELEGFRSFERAVTDERIQQVRAARERRVA